MGDLLIRAPARSQIPLRPRKSPIPCQNLPPGRSQSVAALAGPTFGYGASATCPFEAEPNATPRELLVC